MSRIFRATTIKKNEKYKTKLVKELINYSEKASKSVEKSDREGIAHFLRALKAHSMAQFSSSESRLHEIAKRLIRDKFQNVRLAGLKLAKSFNMKEAIVNAIKTDPNIEIRKTAIECLDKEDEVKVVDELSKCLEDQNNIIKLRALHYFIKEGVQPNSEGLKSIFKIVVNETGVHKNKAKELILKTVERIGIVQMFKFMELFERDVKSEVYAMVASGFVEIYQINTSNLEGTMKGLFKRLLAEKEKMDLESLFVLRLCVFMYKLKNISMTQMIDELELQEGFIHIIGFFLQNEEDYKPHYYMKLQSIILITCIDLEQNVSDILLERYLDVCREVPLLKISIPKDEVQVNSELMEEFDRHLFFNTTYFASDEESVIGTVIEIVREKFKDAESQYMSKLSDLIQDLKKDIAAQENSNSELFVPLNLKLEKTEKKIKKNEESLSLIKQEKSAQSRNEKRALAAKIKKLDSKKLEIIQNKVNKEYRSLLVASYILRYAELSDTIHPEFSSSSQTLFIPNLTSSNLYVSSLALQCLGYSCLLSKEQSLLYYTEFVSRLGDKLEILKALSIVHLFDILLCRRIEDKEVVLKLIHYLWMALLSAKGSIIQFILVEGFSKLLLKNLILSPIQIFVKILFILFDSNTKPDTSNVAQALFKNFVKLSEEKTSELAEAFLVYLIENKNSSNKAQDQKSEKRILNFSSYFGPKVEVPYQMTDNLHMLFFVFCCMNFENNPKFYTKLITSLDLEAFSEDAAKYVKVKITELASEFKNSQKDLEKNIGRLKLGTEIVEDISFREYEKRVEDVINLAEKLYQKDRTIVID